jgi:hypothetical protein
MGSLHCCKHIGDGMRITISEMYASSGSVSMVSTEYSDHANDGMRIAIAEVCTTSQWQLTPFPEHDINDTYTAITEILGVSR